MHPPHASQHLARLGLLLSLFVVLSPNLRAQSNATPIRHALYVALGGDPTVESGYSSIPFAISAGVERRREGSRWGLRLGADYRRKTSDVLSEARWEDFGIAMSARYGKASGPVRPYLIGGVGVADLRTRVRNARYYIDPLGETFPPTSYDESRWNGLFTTGLGTDVTVGRVRLFTEARVNVYPSQLSEHARARSTIWSKALYIGVKF